MNEQETIRFILENSSEPVIKNPVMRAALQEPRFMAQEPRNMYQDGQLVQNTVDGSRPGYQGKRVPTPLPESKHPEFKKLYKAQHPFKTMGKKLGVSYAVLKDLEKDLIDKGNITIRRLLKPGSGRPADFKKVNELKSWLKTQINEFEKTKILPNEKYEIDYPALKKKFNLKHTTAHIYLDTIDEQENLNYTRRELAATQTRQGLTDNMINKYKKEYVTKPITLIAKEITGQPSKNKNTQRIMHSLIRLRDTLMDKNLINPKEIIADVKTEFIPYKGKGGSKTSVARALEVQKKIDLAKKEPGLISDQKYFSKKGPLAGKFNPDNFDRELLKFLNMDTVKGSLDLKFPSFLKPSFEHIQGVTPGSIIGDSKALRTVDIATKRYNFKEMGASSNLYKDVKDYLRVAVKSLQNNESGLANDAIKIVNKVYDKVATRFPNLDRKDLPNYSIKNGIVKEINLKGLIEPKKIEDSFKSYFKNVADTATKPELEKIKRIQPNAFKVIDLFQKGKVNEGYNLIKSRMPSVKGGAKFAVPILAGGAALNFLTSPAEAAETGVVDKAKSWPIEHPWLTGGAAVGATASTKAGRKLLGKIAGGAFGPTGMAGLWYGLGGVDVKDPLDRAGVAGEALLAPTIVKGTEAATKGVKNTALRKLAERGLNLGMTLPMATKVARIASPIGLLSLAGEGIYHAGKKELERREQLSPEELADFHLERQSRGWSRAEAKDGIMSLKKKR